MKNERTNNVLLSWLAMVPLALLATMGCESVDTAGSTSGDVQIQAVNSVTAGESVSFTVTPESYVRSISWRVSKDGIRVDNSCNGLNKTSVACAFYVSPGTLVLEANVTTAAGTFVKTKSLSITQQDVSLHSLPRAVMDFREAGALFATLSTQRDLNQGVTSIRAGVDFTLDFSRSDDEATANQDLQLEVDFDVTDVAPPQSVVAASRTITHRYNAPGTYNGVAKVTNEFGKFSVVYFQMSVSCNDAPINFAAGSTGISVVQQAEVNQHRFTIAPSALNAVAQTKIGLGKLYYIIDYNGDGVPDKALPGLASSPEWQAVPAGGIDETRLLNFNSDPTSSPLTRGWSIFLRDTVCNTVVRKDLKEAVRIPQIAAFDKDQLQSRPGNNAEANGFWQVNFCKSALLNPADATQGLKSCAAMGSVVQQMNYRDIPKKYFEKKMVEYVDTNDTLYIDDNATPDRDDNGISDVLEDDVVGSKLTISTRKGPIDASNFWLLLDVDRLMRWDDAPLFAGSIGSPVWREIGHYGTTFSTTDYTSVDGSGNGVGVTVSKTMKATRVNDVEVNVPGLGDNFPELILRRVDGGACDIKIRERAINAKPSECAKSLPPAPRGESYYDLKDFDHEIDIAIEKCDMTDRGPGGGLYRVEKFSLYTKIPHLGGCPKKGGKPGIKPD